MNKKTQAVRLIGGKWRSRKIHFAENASLRPTPDRVRETVFNWLAPHLVGARCLDLFAGSGVLGFEALSRGAASAVFVEKDLSTLQTLKNCAKELEADTASFYLQDALTWLEQPLKEKFDIVFLDPPFRSGLLEKAILLLQKNNWLESDALFYVEMEREQELILPDNLVWFRQKTTQQICYGILCASSPAE